MTTVVTGYLAVVSVRGFRALVAASVFTTAAETMRMLALAVVVYDATASPLLSAAAYVCGFLPHLCGGALLLSLADRLPPRAVLVASALVRAAAVAVLALDLVGPVVAIAVVFTVGLGAPIASACANALVPDLLTGEAYVRGRSLLGLVSAGMQVVGFTLGGGLLATRGPTATLWFTVLLFGASAAIVHTGLSRTAPRRADRGAVVSATWRTNRALLGDRPIRTLMLAFWLPLSFVAGAESLAVPYAATLGAPAAAGAIFTGFAVGMLSGGLAMGRLVRPTQRERLVVPLAAASGAALMVFAIHPPLWWSVALVVIAGFGLSYELGLQSRLLAAIPTDCRGQGFGLLGVGVTVGQAIAALGSGLLAQVLDAARSMAIAGLLCLVAAGIALRLPIGELSNLRVQKAPATTSAVSRPPVRPSEAHLS